MPKINAIEKRRSGVIRISFDKRKKCINLHNWALFAKNFILSHKALEVFKEYFNFLYIRNMILSFVYKTIKLSIT